MNATRMKWVCFFFISTLSPQAQAIVSFQSALKQTYQNNPELQAQIQQAEKVRGEFIQNGLWLNPSLILNAENIGSSGGYQAFETADTTVSLSQPIPLGGKRGWLQNVSLARYAQMRTAVLRKKAELYIEVGEAYVNAYYTRQWHAVTKKLVRLNEAIVKDIARRKKAGASAELDLRLAQVRLGEARIQQSRAYRDIKIKDAVMIRVIGNTALAIKKLYDHGLPHNDISWQLIDNQMNKSVFVQEKKAEISALRIAITSVKKNVWPTVQVQLGMRHFSLNHNNALVAGVASVMPVYDRNQGKLFSAEAAYSQAMQELRTIKLGLKQRLTSAFLDYRQNSEESEIVKKRLLPAARKASTLAIDGYQKGLYTYVELSNTMRILYDEERHYQQAHAKRDIAMIQITGLLSQGAS